ncbi:MAG: hypothetical protein GY910_06305 [bacterium]|nr:hypothetical protein [Deltaproteobacteria bacterium]MCP4904574.1 hypothetical protein [bacterium]
MAGDDRKLTYSERDRLRREGGGGRPKSGRARADEEKRSHAALQVADALFTDERGGAEGEALATAVRDAHGSAALPDACRAYFDALGAPTTAELASIFLDSGEKEMSVAVLDELLRQKEAENLELVGGLKRQIRLLSEDFDDDLASRAEDLLA